MKEPGHIYVMINPSIEGLVKIGKTTRDPETRAKELSCATGVATPFCVAFSIKVADCHAAEEYVYAILEHNGFKRSPNREFFEISVRQAIKVLLLAENELRDQPSDASDLTEASPELSEGLDGKFACEHPGTAILEKAVELYMGSVTKLRTGGKACNFSIVQGL